ncbi:hypothetical protein V6N12_059870 [Hibiscus sabdariffa]|uniref:Uncharacterized protein n=1 Tax=Hibiscus sabdariffa TaxID=183260 RepID=A0ABR2BCC9_9ROSI
MTQRMGKVGRASGLACSNRVMAWVSACSLGMVTEAAATPATDHAGHHRGGDSGEPSSPKYSTQSPLPLHQAVDEGSMVVYGRRELGNGAVEMVRTCGSKGWFDNGWGFRELVLLQMAVEARKWWIPMEKMATPWPWGGFG